MNAFSKITNYILNHPDTWRDDFTELNILVKEDGNLAIFNYGLAADFGNELVCEARGIIIDLTTLEVVCWPFRKFNNWNNQFADEIDWYSAKVQEKLDGSIIKRYFYNNEWCWATNGVIDASKSPVSETIAAEEMNFMQLIKSASNYESACNEFTDTDMTYIFELTSPSNRVVVPYKTTDLTIIGIRNNITGQEYNYEGEFKAPKLYYARNFEQCQQLLSTMNKHGVVEHEGFVVVDKNFNRIKIKTEEFFAMHHVLQFNSLTKYEIVRLALSHNKILDTIKRQYADVAVIIDYYTNEVKNLISNVDSLIQNAYKIYEQVDKNKKDFAETIKDYSNNDKSIMFYVVDHLAEYFTQNIIGAKDSSIDNYIKDYKN